MLLQGLIRRLQTARPHTSQANPNHSQEAQDKTSSGAARVGPSQESRRVERLVAWDGGCSGGSGADLGEPAGAAVAGHPNHQRLGGFRGEQQGNTGQATMSPPEREPVAAATGCAAPKRNKGREEHSAMQIVLPQGANGSGHSSSHAEASARTGCSSGSWVRR